MFSHSLLLVLLVLTCLQSFTTAEESKGPESCCFSYQIKPIPVQAITGYEVTNLQCTNPGVVFTLKGGRHACANPGDQWVQNSMNKIDQDLFKKAKSSV